MNDVEIEVAAGRTNATQQIVVKANDLIQKSRYELSLQEQRMILYFVTLIRPEDDDFKEYTVDIRDLCRICEIQLCGVNYQNFIESVKKLKERTVYIVENRVHKFMSWIEHVEIDEKTYTLTYRLDERLKPYLLQLKGRFTQYALENVLFYKSKYSIRLYELLASYSEYEIAYVKVDDLRGLMGAPEFCEDFRRFRDKILNPSVQEINELSDLTVSMDFVKEGRKITTILFNIKRKSSAAQTLVRFHRVSMAGQEQRKRTKKAAKTAENADLQEG